MAGDPLPRRIDGKMIGDEVRKLGSDIGPHSVVGRPWLFGRVDVKAGANPEIPRPFGIVRDIVATRAGVRRDEDYPLLGASSAILALFRDICLGAGEAAQIP